MPSTQPWTPTYDFSQGGYNGVALQAQLEALAANLADQDAALDVPIRADDTLSDGIVRLRNLHPEVKDTLSGINYLEGVQVVATTNQATAGLLTIDGVTLTAGQRVLLTAQTTPTQNGLWVTSSPRCPVTPTLTPGGNSSGVRPGNALTGACGLSRPGRSPMARSPRTKSRRTRLPS
jgi:hypothetical protein